VGIEGQMVGEQIDVVTKKCRQTLPTHSGDTTVLPTPEVTMMDQHRIRPARHRCIQKRLARRHATHNAPHLRPSFHLQAVWAIILEACHLEQSVEIALQFDSFHDRFPVNLH
jgi:hypothetical protein